MGTHFGGTHPSSLTTFHLGPLLHMAGRSAHIYPHSWGFLFVEWLVDLGMNKQLGRLEKIKNIRDIWDTEDRDFTPWLAEENNIALLGDAIGLSLEVEAQEKAVGPFRADILCKDTADDSWVLIENQLERTDHKHLGQLMTYASGLKAVTIVWLATKFTEEHRSSLDWLNQITDDSFNFFGLEIELWKIDDSLIAPKFNVVSKPNDWSRSVVAASKSTELSPNPFNKQIGLGEFSTR